MAIYQHSNAANFRFVVLLTTVLACRSDIIDHVAINAHISGTLNLSGPAVAPERGFQTESTKYQRLWNSTLTYYHEPFGEPRRSSMVLSSEESAQTYDGRSSYVPFPSHSDNTRHNHHGSLAHTATNNGTSPPHACSRAFLTSMAVSSGNRPRYCSCASQRDSRNPTMITKASASDMIQNPSCNRLCGLNQSAKPRCK